MLKFFDRQIARGIGGQEDEAVGSLHLGLTSKAIRGKAKNFGREVTPRIHADDP